MISYPFLGICIRFFEVLDALAVTKDHHIASEEACSVALATTKPSREPFRSLPMVQRRQPWLRTWYTLIILAQTPP